MPTHKRLTFFDRVAASARANVPCNDALKNRYKEFRNVLYSPPLAKFTVISLAARAACCSVYRPVFNRASNVDTRTAFSIAVLVFSIQFIKELTFLPTKFSFILANPPLAPPSDMAFKVFCISAT